LNNNNNNNKFLAITFSQEVIELVTEKFQNFAHNAFYFANGHYAPPKVGQLKKSSTHEVALLKSWA
jgi:hypothetical protein